MESQPEMLKYAPDAEPLASLATTAATEMINEDLPKLDGVIAYCKPVGDWKTGYAGTHSDVNSDIDAI